MEINKQFRPERKRERDIYIDREREREEKERKRKKWQIKNERVGLWRPCPELGTCCIFGTPKKI